MFNLNIKHLFKDLYKASTKHEIRPDRRVLVHTEVSQTVKISTVHIHITSQFFIHMKSLNKM